MRRIALIALALLAAGAVVILPAATGADDGPYEVRAYFDNGGFIANDEEIRVAGAMVGTVKSLDVSRPDEIVSNENGGTAIPGKAVIVMTIDDDGFKNFRQDASCIIRPASLIGEKYVDCTPTQPRAPGVEPPPELETIPDGERGEGERFLPLENNGKAVDLDLINNINRVPYRDRFRLILNDLGAGLAARGDDLGAIIDRANPALRQTNNVLNILAQQSDQLASLASNGDQVLEPLARNRTSITGFFRNAAIAGEATAERGDDLEAGLQKFPETLRQVRLTMTKLKEFADQGTPLFTDIRTAAPHLSKATQKLAPFAKATIPALDTLGDAAQSAGPKLVASDGLLVDLRDQTEQLGPAAQSLGEFLDTFIRTNGAQYLAGFLYNSAGGLNTFDSFGRFQRANVQVTNCINVSNIIIQGCEAFFQDVNLDTSEKKKKKKKSKKSSAKFQGGVAPPSETATQAEPPASIEELIPELSPEDPGVTPEEPGDEETGEEPGAEDEATEESAKQEAQLRKLGLDQQQIDQMSWSDAALLLEFLLGGSSMRGGRMGSLAASPTLVGAVTVLVVVVAVFLSYQANQGLPFVPTYKVSALLPNAGTLTPGNEVRVGGIRVGQVTAVQPETVEDAPCPGDPEAACVADVAKVDLELDQTLDPLPDNSTLIVRARSSIGNKYLEIQRGDSETGYAQGSTLPLTAAQPEPVEIDEVFNTFDPDTRAAIQANLTEFGNALAGRGVNLNAAIGDLRPLVERLEPVMRNLAAPETGLGRFVSALSAAAAEAAPVAEIQGQLFVDLETTFRAFADVSRPYIQDFISKGPETEDVAIATLPKIRPLLANTAGFFADLRPGFAAFAPVSPQFSNAISTGVKAVRLSPQLNAQLDPTAQALLNLSNNAAAREGITDITAFATELRPTAAFISPAQSVCNYASILFRNVSSLSQYGDGIGTNVRAIVLNPPQGTNSEAAASSAPANSVGTGETAAANFLHYNPYPNTASPGQEFECEGGQREVPPGPGRDRQRAGQPGHDHLRADRLPEVRQEEEKEEEGQEVDG